MKRIKFELRIWKFSELIFTKRYEFNSQNDADNYAVGFYNAYLELGNSVTGYKMENMELLEYEIKMLNGAFKRCYGLKDAFLKSYNKEGEELLYRGALDGIAENAGLRLSFVENHAKDIYEFYKNK